MFTYTEFSKLGKKLLSDSINFERYPGLYYVTYPQYSFTVPDGEETIRISRAPKTSNDDGMKFWLASEWLAGWHGKEELFSSYITDSAFEKITEDEMNFEIFTQCSGLISPPPLPVIGGQEFIGALMMYSLKTEFIISIFAEYTNEYLHFYWDTTA
ncbi:hypothetical protein [Pseudomonas sp. EA_35y_Pfl2_R111]|uniref:hypothetical protein n=1 Tax=Pseudomonas sp. EA_35y_Pfl2_R111 TaxID=3088689 RepID=UPI0030DCF7DE